MRRIVVILIALVLSLDATAQSLKIGSKAPDLTGLVWLTRPPAEHRRTTLVEFLHSSNAKAYERIVELERLATHHADSLNVVVVTRMDDSAAHDMLANAPFYVVSAEPRFMRSVGVQFAPYAYVACPKRHTLWCGNPIFLEDKQLEILISDGTYHDRPLRKAASGRARR